MNQRIPSKEQRNWFTHHKDEKTKGRESIYRSRSSKSAAGPRGDMAGWTAVYRTAVASRGATSVDDTVLARPYDHGVGGSHGTREILGACRPSTAPTLEPGATPSGLKRLRSIGSLTVRRKRPRRRLVGSPTASGSTNPRRQIGRALFVGRAAWEGADAMVSRFILRTADS